MLSTQEATLRTQRKSSLHQTSQFIIQHITDSFEKASGVDPITSIFNNQQGKISLLINTETKQYELQGSRLSFDDTYISPTNVIIESFYLEPIYKGEDTIVGVRSTIEVRSVGDSKLIETINILSLIR
jgi:hypothetical protein